MRNPLPAFGMLSGLPSLHDSAKRTAWTEICRAQEDGRFSNIVLAALSFTHESCRAGLTESLMLHLSAPLEVCDTFCRRCQSILRR